MQQRTQAPPPMSKYPGVVVPPALEAIVMKLLEKIPDHRYQRASELVSVLDTAMLSMGIGAVPDLGRESEESSPAPLLGAPDLAPPSLEVGPEESAAERAESIPSAPPPPAARPLAEFRERAARRVSALYQSLPPDGRFPRWAYVGLPLLGIGVLVGVLLMASRIPGKSETAAPAESAAPAEVKPPPAAEPTKVSEKVSEPAAPPVAAVPVASATPKPAADLSGLDAGALRGRLRNAARQRDWTNGAAAVLALLRVEPRAFREYDVANATRAIAVGIDQAGGEPTAQFFSALAHDAGQSGLDLLYDVSRFRPGSKAAKTSLDMLRRPDVMAKASAPLRVLVGLREAPCAGKKDWFGKVGEQGDDRGLFELELLRDTECPRRNDPCCYRDDKALASAIRAVKSRLAASAPAAPAPP